MLSHCFVSFNVITHCHFRFSFCFFSFLYCNIIYEFRHAFIVVIIFLFFIPLVIYLSNSCLNYRFPPVLQSNIRVSRDVIIMCFNILHSAIHQVYIITSVIPMCSLHTMHLSYHHHHRSFMYHNYFLCKLF